jgi:hypothetical protein
MKPIKIVLTVLLFLSLGAGVYFTLTSAKSKTIARSLKGFPVETELPKGIDSAYIEELRNHGFHNSPQVKTWLNVVSRKWWKEQYGLCFIGDDEMTKFLLDNDFIMGEAGKFLDNVPVEAGKEMMSNLKRIENWLPSLGFGGFILDGDTIRQTDPIRDRKIFIIAAAGKFDTTGMVLREGILEAIAPPDPIAVVKVDYGWVELANW